MRPANKFVELDKVHHDRSAFECGEKDLDSFIRTQAAKHMEIGISKTMVLPGLEPLSNGNNLFLPFIRLPPVPFVEKRYPSRLPRNFPFILCRFFSWHKWPCIQIAKVKALERSL